MANSRIEAAKRRINLRRRMQGKADSLSNNYSKEELLSICFYLYNYMYDVSNAKIVVDCDDAIALFIECTSLLKKTERLSAVLKNQVASLEKSGILTVFSEDSARNICFDGSEIPYYYEQDKMVDRTMRHYNKIDEHLVNIHRIILNHEKPIFASLINTTIFCSGSDLSLQEDIKLHGKMADMVFDISKTKFLVDQVRLSDDEARYILLEYRFSTIKRLQHLERSELTTAKKAAMIGMTERDLRAMLRSNENLKMFGFIESDGDYNASLLDCIEEQSIEPYFTDLLKPLDCSGAYELDSFSIKEDSKEICLDLLKGEKPVSLLFYGKPGSGKTELAKALCRHTDKKIYMFKNEAESNNEDVFERLVCLLSMERPDSILIVDEADSLLKTIDFSFFRKTPSKTKGTVNKMLENNMNKVIYIINHQDQIDESTRRRFTFSIKFESMPVSMLHAIAESKLEPIAIADTTKTKILQLLDKYNLTGASVDNIVKVIEGMSCKDEATLLHKVRVVMQENSVLLHGKTKMRGTVKNEYDPSVLNASMDPLKIVNMVQNAAKFAEKNKGTESGIRMLFYGLSGTGKTELARYISEKLDKQILLKRASDIFGMYVGQNEQNIRDAFAEAETSGAVLLFDEADSFFQDRNKAHRGWEISMVNEFLTQMEEFSGILICTTNLRKIMDPAMQRRFHMLVEFKPMKFEGIKTMMERYFPAYHLSNREIEALEDSESVTPGDFGALAGRIRFMNQDDVNAEYILTELKKLQEEKKKQWCEENGSSSTCKIGFTA